MAHALWRNALKFWLSILALATTLPLQANAQSPESPEPIPSGAALDRMCSPQGAMQFAFGQHGVPGSSKIESMMERKFKLPAPLAPFTHAMPRSTEWSDQFMEMTYSVRIAKAEEARATGLMDRLAKALEAQGWTRLDIAEGQEPMYLVGYSGQYAFSRPLPEPGERKRVVLSLGYDLGALTLACGRDDLLFAHAGEVFGKLPPGTPRPTVPDIALPAISTAADCNSPDLQQQTLALFADGGADRFTGVMLARTGYRDRLTMWMLWRLDSSGKISTDRLLEVSMSALSKASPGGNPFAAMELIDEIFPIIDQMKKAEDSKDAAQMCRSLIPFHALMLKADAITLKQTQATQAALSAEAKRLGISLD